MLICTLLSCEPLNLQAPEHMPTSLQITPTKEANPDTATPSPLQQPVPLTTVSHILF